MHWLKLPPTAGRPAPAFLDAAGAKGWLAAQPQAQPALLLVRLGEQVRALDSEDIAPPLRLELLDLLRRASIPAQANLEARYSRKALPMPADDQKVFNVAQGLWTLFGIAYLRLAPHFSPDKGLPLHRAAIAVRLAQYCHYQASRPCPPLLDQLLFGVLAEAEGSGVLGQAMADREFPHLGEANITGLIAWAFLLRLTDPYALSGPQLAVANRALSRWRELCAFRNDPGDDPKALAADLGLLFGGPLPAGLPRWLDVRPVRRKIRSRIASLKAGETPEALKLGRELSATACIRLLGDIERHLRKPDAPQAAGPDGDIELAFGCEHAYTVFTGEAPNPSKAMNAKSSAISHERMRVFGFDNVAELATAVQRVEVPTETWTLTGGIPGRGGDDGPRRLTPCLVATLRDGQPRLGVLSRLLCDAQGGLTARLSWFEQAVAACIIEAPPGQAGGPRLAALLLENGDGLTLILPVNAGVRLNAPLRLQGARLGQVVPLEVIERGVDFVRYTCLAQ